MSTLRAILSEIVGLFVDDGSLAVLLVLWCVLIGLLAAFAPSLQPFGGPLLLAGCAVVLLANVVRTARSRR